MINETIFNQKDLIIKLNYGSQSKKQTSPEYCIYICNIPLIDEFSIWETDDQIKTRQNPHRKQKLAPKLNRKKGIYDGHLFLFLAMFPAT